MKPCAYRWEIIGDVVECGNTVNLYHNGTVPVSVCEICPYRKQPDYLSDNSRLYTLQQSQGVYVPRPRTCGGCGTVKVHSPLDRATTTAGSRARNVYAL